MPKVVTITAAPPGWFSLYDDNGEIIEMPVVLWALVEDERDPSLRWPTSFSMSENGGILTFDDGETDDKTSNFKGYAYRPPGATTTG